MLHFSLIFIANHSIIILSQADLYQIISYFLYSLVHSIVNLNKHRGKAEHKKHENILKTHLIVFPCILWKCIRGPVDTHVDWMFYHGLNAFGAGKAWMILGGGCRWCLPWHPLFIALRCKMQVSGFIRRWIIL